MRNYITGIFGSIQLATYAIVVIYAFFVSLAIGHWPSYNNPDPGTLPTSFLTPVIYLLIFASLLSLPTYPVVATLIEGKKFFKKWHFWVFMIGTLIWTLDTFYLNYLNPREDGLLSWVFD